MTILAVLTLLLIIGIFITSSISYSRKATQSYAAICLSVAAFIVMCAYVFLSDIELAQYKGHIISAHKDTTYIKSDVLLDGKTRYYAKSGNDSYKFLFETIKVSP